MSLNKVMLIGRLGRDPEVRYSQNGQMVVNFNLATDESYTSREGEKIQKTEWHRIVAFARTAELIANYLKKGSLVYLEGSLQTRKWQDQQGFERFTTEIRANGLRFLDSKRDGQSAGGNDAAGGGMPDDQPVGGSEDSRGNRGNSHAHAGHDEVPF